MANELHFFKGRIHIVKKHVKKCSPSLAINQMQIKTTLRLHLTPGKIATIIGENVGRNEVLYTASRNIN
jgi:hypothetical protein